MYSITDLLKDGYKHYSGKSDVTTQCIEAVENLAKITRTSLGPHGMNKMIVNHLEKLFVTNDAATILKELDIVHPAAKMCLHAAQMQEQEIGDGTNLVLILISELLNNAELLLQKGLHINDITSGYLKGQAKAFEILEGLKVWSCQDVKNIDQVSRALRGCISSKQYGYEDLLAPLIAKACVQVCPRNPHNFNVDNVRVAKIVGGGVGDTTVIKGHVLVRDTEGVIKHLTNAKVAVFTGGIEVAKTETKDTVVINTAKQLTEYNKSEELAIEDIVKKISEAGINMVVSGGAVSELGLHFLEKYKIMVVKVLSKFELRRICKTIGATALVRLGAPTPEETGHCDVITVEEIGSTKCTIFRQEKEESGISTIVVRGSTQNLLDDIERCVDDAVNVYKTLVRDPRFLPGAGATEIELSRIIQAYGGETPGLMQYSIKRYGEAFEVIPRTISENAGLKTTEILASLYAAHQKGEKSFGIDVEEGVARSAEDLNILDLLATKVSAIKLATDAAVTVLKVDQIIMAKMAGGPKPPAQGARDD